MNEKPFDIELTAYTDAESGRVVIAAACENTTDEDATFKSMNSGVFSWQITDEEGRQYIEPMGNVQAPHRISVEPDKAYVALRSLENPEEKVERWQKIEWYENAEVITDPAEIESRDIGGHENVVAAPTIDPEIDRELTAVLRTRDTDENEYKVGIDFVPSELNESTEDEIFEDVDVDEDAAVSLTGRKTDIQDFSKFTTKSMQKQVESNEDE